MVHRTPRQLVGQPEPQQFGKHAPRVHLDFYAKCEQHLYSGRQRLLFQLDEWRTDVGNRDVQQSNKFTDSSKRTAHHDPVEPLDYWCGQCDRNRERANLEQHDFHRHKHGQLYKHWPRPCESDPWHE